MINARVERFFMKEQKTDEKHGMAWNSKAYLSQSWPVCPSHEKGGRGI
jgi:hypothetical protein